LYFDVAYATTPTEAIKSPTTATASAAIAPATAATTTNLQHKFCPHDETIFNYLLQ